MPHLTSAKSSIYHGCVVASKTVHGTEVKQILLFGFTVCPYTGLLISGGYEAKSSVELFVPATGESCSLPNLPDERYGHTMNGLYICGGNDIYDSPCLNYTGEWSPVENCRSPSTGCVHFTSGQWQYSPQTFVKPRRGHMSWQTEKGLVLMCGDYSYFTSEIIPTEEGHEEAGLSLKLKNSHR